MEWRLLSLLSFARLSNRRPNFTATFRTVYISFKKFGESLEPHYPRILIIHDLLGNKKLWAGVAKTISNVTKEAVMTLDVRNHGDSPHVNSHRYTECAEDIQELMAKQRINKVFLLGFSLGGRIAMSLSLMQPELVSGLIIVEISPVSSCPILVNEYPKFMEEMQKVDFSKIEKKTNSDIRSEIIKAQKYANKKLRDKIRDEQLMKKILTNIAVKNGAISWTCNLDVFIKHFKYIVAFPKILLNNVYYGPTIFIGGQKSDFLPPDDLPRIRELFPNAIVKYIPKTGHNVHYDNPKLFMEHVISFIKQYRD